MVKISKGQIAVILTLMMAVVFLVILVAINIGNIAQEKTMVSNAADSAALLLASSLGSMANALRMELGLYHGRVENCDLDLKLIGSLIALVAAIALTIATFGTQGWALALTISGILGSLASTAAFTMGMVNAMKSEPGLFKQIELKFQNMSLEQRIKERTLQNALFAMVSDPNKSVDTNDENMDGDNTDYIYNFYHWYNERLKALPRLGSVVDTLWQEMFSQELTTGKAPRIYVQEDPENWQVIDNGLWIDVNGDNQPNTMDDGTLKFEVASDNEHDLAGVVYARDIYFTDWIDERFIPLAKKLYDYGYGLSGDWDATQSEINNFKKEVMDFEDTVKGLYSSSFDAQVQSFDEWMPALYNSGSKDDWYDRMGECINKIRSWIDILRLREDDINAGLMNCGGNGPWVCGAGAGGSDCGCDSSGRYYGQLCPSLHCRPDFTLATPTGGERQCCDSVYYLHYQPCDALLYSSSGGACPGISCEDTYHNCEIDSRLNVITREHAIEYLEQFIDDVGKLRTAFQTAYLKGKEKKDDPRANAILYGWTDRVGKRGEVTEQLVRHLVYVKIENLKSYTKGVSDVNDDGQPEYKFPYIHQWRKWLPPSTCSTVASDKGSFEITVGRYDEDIGKSPGAPLRKLWTFKTRAVGTEPSLPSPLVTPSDVVANPELVMIVLEKGIVSTTRGYYGPGETYTKEEMQTRSTEAAQRNRDIKIQRLK